MIYSNLTSFLTTNIGADIKEIEMQINNLKKMPIKKGSYVLREGEVAKYSYYVELGLLKYYSIDKKGKEHIIQFAPEGWFVADRESIFCNQPSKYYIQAIEDTTVYLLDENFFQCLSNDYKNYQNFNTRILHNHIRQLQNRINLLLSATAEERYLDFIKIYPDMLLRVPQTLVASYLGITPESLSRVRKDLALKNFKK